MKPETLKSHLDSWGMSPLYTHPQPAAPVIDESAAKRIATALGWKPAAQWVGLTDEEIDQGLCRTNYAMQTAHAWRAGVVFAMTQLKEKHT